MSVSSMTGHGRGQSAAAGITVTVEISSVNRKQLDVSVDLPRSLNTLAPRLEEAVQQALSRGRVTVEVLVKYSSSARRRGVCVDCDLAEAYLQGLRKTARKLGLKDVLDAAVLVDLPDVVRYEQPEQDLERAWPLVQKALKSALGGLVAMRKREGGALGRDLARRLDRLAGLAGSVRKLTPAVADQYRKKLMSRLEAAGLPVDLSDERLLREVAIFADKADISEELTRFDSHLDQARKLMDSAVPVGRSLEFLVQELFREANTMGSKANDAAIARDVVEIKAELERIREQVQNIE